MVLVENGQAVHLVLEKATINKYMGGSFEARGNKKSKVSKVLVGKNFEMYDQTGCRIFHADFETLLLLKAWCHIAKISTNIIASESARYRMIQTGRGGFSMNFDDGVIQEIDEGGQFDEQGVKAGWKIKGCDDKVYSEKTLRKSLKGSKKKKSFIIAFEEVVPEPEANAPVETGETEASNDEKLAG